MLNNNYNILKNKYFFILCFYLKNNKNYIYQSLFIGYKYNYLMLNINFFLYSLKNILNLIKIISSENGNILILGTKNLILDYLLMNNCKKYNIKYLHIKYLNKSNIISKLKRFPDLIISFNYQHNNQFLNQINKYNIPTICFNNILTSFFIKNTCYPLIFNNNSLYSNILLIFVIFNIININKKIISITNDSKL